MSLAKKGDLSGFDYIGDFENDFAQVNLNKKWNFIDTNGNLLSQQWFDGVSDFNEYGISIVKLNKKWNLIDKNGNFISQQWFDGVSYFDKNGIAQVMLNKKYNLIDTNGKLLSQQWFNSFGEAYDYLIKLQ